MDRLIDHLPGIELPVDAVVATLRHMWDGDATDGSGTQGYRASQMNLLLHLGMRTRPEEARACFATAVEFAQRYPCRLLVLCPTELPQEGAEFIGKVYSQCFLSPQLREACCCESLILSFAPGQSDYLESQLSLWLEADLPVYQWFHRVPPARIGQHYHNIIKRSRRVLFDRTVEGEAYDAVDFGSADRVRDLAHARTLPLRQNIGQFLSAFAPSALVSGLQRLEFTTYPGMMYECQHLLDWHKAALQRCLTDKRALPELQLEAREGAGNIRIDWRYRDPSSFISWEYHPASRAGRIRLDLAGVSMDHPLHIELMSPAAALAEALFFG